MKHAFLRVFAGAILLSLLFVAAQPINAFADEGTPPPPTEEPAPMEEAAPVEEVAPIEEIAPIEGEAPIAAEPVATEVVASEPVMEPVVTEEVATESMVGPAVIEEVATAPELAPADDLAATLADLPEGTELVVLDEQGETLPLASEDAADVIASGDPRWCPVSVTPGGVGCSTPFSSFQDLIDWLIGNPKSVAGVIWIEKTYDSSINDNGVPYFDLNGDDFGTTANYALTLKGGWNGGAVITITPYDYSEFYVPLNIYNWHNDITLSDILISSTDGTGLSIDTSGKITLTRVDSSDNDGDGASLDNFGYGVSKDVVVTDSTFSGNGAVYGGNGLSIYSDGNITLTNVIADSNHVSWNYDEYCDAWDEFDNCITWVPYYYADYGQGAHLDNGWNFQGKNVVVTNSSFEFNEGNGLDVFSYGNITLTNVTASKGISAEYYDIGLDEYFYSYPDGANLNNEWADTPKTVIINNSTFEYNADDGLDVYSLGSITVKDITAIGNGYNGAYLYNRHWDDDLGAYLGIGTVTLTGTNVFGQNGNTGLYVYSNGAILANNIIANANDWRGAYFSNCNWDFDLETGCLSSAPVTLTGTNEFKFNARGLYVYSGGVITLNNINASNNNDGAGASLDNVDSKLLTKPGITINGTNIFNENGGNGLEAFSKGAIKINNLTANNNYMKEYCYWDEELEEDVCYWDDGSGAYLINHYSDNPPQPVTITVSGGNPDTEFKWNENYGIYIESKGAISLTGVVAEGNGYGGYLDNWWTGAVGGITVSGWGAGFSDNTNYGLEAYSKGAISFTHLYAWNNGWYGAHIDNTGGTGTVTITGESSFGNNGGTGLEIESKGTITAANLYAENNNGSGVILDNTNSMTGLANITLTGVNTFNNNYDGNGLEVNSYGTISVANINAFNNQGTSGGFGAYFDNYQSGLGLVKPITLSGNNTFESNGWTGLDIASKGAITINNVITHDNGGYGALLNNQLLGAVGAINVNNTSTYWPEFARNGLNGLLILSNGAVTVKDLDAYENGWLENSRWDDFGQTGYGVYIDNTGGTGNVMLGTARLKWCNGLSDNFLSGLEVYSNGTVTLSNLCNSGNGKDLQEDPLDEYESYGYGAYVFNLDGGPLKNVTLNGNNSFNDNASGGLYVYSAGIVTLNNLEASENGWRSSDGDGVYIDNCDFYDDSCHLSTPKAVSVLGNNDFGHNFDGGLEIHSLGAITLGNFEAYENRFGVLLDNNEAGAVGGVSITGTGGHGTYENSWNGLFATTLGTISVNVGDMWAGDNGYSGWYLDNHQSTALTPPGVTLSTTNPDWAYDFVRNGFDGLLIESRGNISVAGLDAYDNGGSGAFLNNYYGTGTVTIFAPVSGENTFSGNWGNGLTVLSNRAITIGKINAHDNGLGCFWDPCAYNDTDGFGVWLDNRSGGETLAPSITINNFGDFSNNSQDGLRVLSFGIITLNNITANDNGQYNYWVEREYPPEAWEFTLNSYGLGANVDNCGYAEVDTDVFDCTSISVAAKGITLNGSNTFNGNFLDGLWVTSYGAIKANNLTANWNGVAGAYLDNAWGPVLAGVGVTLTGANHFEGNLDDGLQVYSHGSITLSNITSQWNWSDGAELSNYAATGPVVNVTLTGKNIFNGNGDAEGTGLYVSTEGNITLYNVTANGNMSYGAYLYSDSSNVILYRTLTGANTFNDNHEDGLYIEAFGNLTLNKVTADNNWSTGVYVDAGGNILWSCGSLTNNDVGWSLGAGGTITLKSVWALGNWTQNTDHWGGTLLPIVRSC
jgi:hypothetical protein